MSCWHVYHTMPLFTGWQPVYLRRAILLVSRIVLQKRSCHFMPLEQSWLNGQDAKKQSTAKETPRGNKKKQTNKQKPIMFPAQSLVFRHHKICQTRSALKWLAFGAYAQGLQKKHTLETPNRITGLHRSISQKREKLPHFWSSCWWHERGSLGLHRDHKSTACNFYLLWKSSSTISCNI